MTWADSESAASQPTAHSGSPGRAPMPRMPSSTTSASPSPLGSVVSTDAGRLGSRPGTLVHVVVVHGDGVPAGLREAGHGVQRVGSVVPRSDQRGDGLAVALLEPGGGDSRQAFDRPGISSPSSSVAISAASAARTHRSTRPRSSVEPSAMTTADAMPASWDSDRCSEVMPSARPAPHGAADLEVRAAVGASVHLGVVPVHAAGGARAP